MRLNALRFGLAAGILWSCYMLLYTIIAMYTGHATALMELMANIYPGYSISWSGAVFGMIFGFLDGFIGLSLLAWIYNKLL